MVSLKQYTSFQVASAKFLWILALIGPPWVKCSFLKHSLWAERYWSFIHQTYIMCPSLKRGTESVSSEPNSLWKGRTGSLLTTWMYTEKEQSIPDSCSLVGISCWTWTRMHRIPTSDEVRLCPWWSETKTWPFHNHVWAQPKTRMPKTTKLSTLSPLPAYKMAALSLPIPALLFFSHLLDKSY